MSQTDASFDSLSQAIRSLWPEDQSSQVDLRVMPRMLLLTSPSDVAAFSVFDGCPDREFDETYAAFKNLYRQNSRDWDTRTLSFVACRTSENSTEDRFYASLEHDSLFCRKYVIRAVGQVDAQRNELLRLPFLPLRSIDEHGARRPQSAQDFLQSAGLSASLARKFVEAGHRSADRIATELRDGVELLPENLDRPRAKQLAPSNPRSHSRLVSLTVEGFRAYRDLRTFDLDASVVVLYGPNGLGKTSVFDAIDYAATGRIGRLCSRQRRSHTDFSRIATHLDKTPGTGSVNLLVRNSKAAPPDRDWKLQRSTGNWSTAWINGDEVDRKGVINKLAQATWVDSSPRQQNLETLFRATHLFGQGEQELLTEFQKDSVIPESFISEMLALQDYSQGIAKVSEVIASLSNDRSTANSLLSELSQQRILLVSDLQTAPPAEVDLAQQMPIDDAVEDLRNELASAKNIDPLPLDLSNKAAFSEWLEILSARATAADRRIHSIRSLQDELPNYKRLAEESAGLQLRIKEIDAALDEIQKEEKNLSTEIDTTTSLLSKARAERLQQEQKRRDLTQLVEVDAQRKELETRIKALEEERDRQLKTKADADFSLLSSEEYLSHALSEVSEAERATRSNQTRRVEIRDLLADFPQFLSDLDASSELSKQLEQLNQNVERARTLEREAVVGAQEAKRLREALLPDYERALAQQAELGRLLDSIQVHIHDKSCPLCGSEFESVESLIVQIRAHRQAASIETDITLRYKELVSRESQADAAHRTTKANLAAAIEAVADLTKRRDAIETRLAAYRDRLGSAGIESSATYKTLNARNEKLGQEQEALKTKAAQANESLKSIQTSREQETTTRDSSQVRIAELDQEIRELKSNLDRLNSRLLQGLGGTSLSREDLDLRISAIAEEIAKINLLEEQLQSRRQTQLDSSRATQMRKQIPSSQRDQALSRLNEVSKPLIEYRNRLRSYDVGEEVTLDSLNRVLLREEQDVTTTFKTLERGRVILAAMQARELRLQILERQAELDGLSQRSRTLETRIAQLTKLLAACSAIERLLQRERQAAIERHIAAYGPMITTIQQRLRSVYGFGEVRLEARGGEATVQVEWRSKNVHVPPTDFFSDSQRQILMLSIFLAGGLRQNWSGFAPMLLDDPVTHFDDLNAYGFVELVRGIISTSPDESQLIISTCEDRLFSLMQKKFSRLPSGAIFYEFMGMSEKGPIVERR